MNNNLLIASSCVFIGAITANILGNCRIYRPYAKPRVTPNVISNLKKYYIQPKKKNFEITITICIDGLIDRMAVIDFERQYKNHCNIDLIIRSTGGPSYCSQQITNILHKHTGIVSCYIHSYAWSAGTIIAMWCDNIYIKNSYSVSPIDTIYNNSSYSRLCETTHSDSNFDRYNTFYELYCEKDLDIFTAYVNPTTLTNCDDLYNDHSSNQIKFLKNSTNTINYGVSQMYKEYLRDIMSHEFIINKHRLPRHLFLSKFCNSNISHNTTYFKKHLAGLNMFKWVDTYPSHVENIIKKKFKTKIDLNNLITQIVGIEFGILVGCLLWS